jgi:hypothetical protein
VSAGCGIGLREAEVPNPALLLVDLRFSIARPSLDFQAKAASRKRRKYWPEIFFSVSAIFYSGLGALTQFPKQL